MSAPARRLQRFAIYAVEEDASGRHYRWLGEQEGFDRVDAKQTWWHRHPTGVGLPGLVALPITDAA
jgi:hypothetical protein